MNELLTKYGIPTYITSIFTDLGSVASATLQIGKQMPNNVGLIYGMSIYIGGVVPDAAGKSMITLADAGKLYINLVSGSLTFLNYLKLDQLAFSSGTNITSSRKYLPVNIPANFDLDQSKYYNPESLTDLTIGLQLWYIDVDSYNKLIANKILTGTKLVMSTKQ